MPINLYTGNPNKFKILQYLIHYHDIRGHKILIFIDNVFLLKRYALALGRPYLSGEVKDEEREKILQFFSHLADWNVLFVSRVGDVGIDLPDANVAIEVMSQFGSRRQETQRLGRILRPKEHTKDKQFDSYFYSLVSGKTEEVTYALKRQKFLIRQGYSFIIKRYSDYAEIMERERFFPKKTDLKDEEELIAEFLREAISERGTGLGIQRGDDLKLVVNERNNSMNAYMDRRGRQ